MPLFDKAEDLPVIDPTKDYYEELVGEGKKFADNKALAFGKVNSDIHITTLERSLDEMRAELAKRQTAEELLTQVRDMQQPNNQQQQQVTTPQATEGKQITEADIEKILNEREAARNKERNLDTAVSKLKEIYGADYQSPVIAKAKELGVTPEFMENLARTSPQAFLAYFPQQTQQRSFFSAPGTQVNTTTTSNTNEKGYSYYANIQKTDKNKFYSAAFQREFMLAGTKAREAGKYDQWRNT